MRFSTAILAAAAFTGFANAVQFTNSVFNNVTAGQPFTLTWSNATGAVTITLKNGPALNLKDVSVVGSGLSGGSFVYNVPKTLPADTYAFEIKDGSGSLPNYSPQFQLIGGAAATTSSGAATQTSNSTQTTHSASGTASATASASASGAANGTATRSATQSGTRSATASGTPSQTRAPSSGVAVTSNLALLFLFAGALMTLN